MPTEPIHEGVPLSRRYERAALERLTRPERERITRCGDPGVGAWEMLYSIDPGLYDRLVAGERLHPGIVDWLPDRIGTAVEVAAGTGRLTLQIAARCGRLVAVERAAPMRRMLRERLAAAGSSRVSVCGGDVRELPLRDACADVVLSCAALTPDPLWGGDRGLAELERVCRRGGVVVLVWPHSPAWLEARGYRREVFTGDMAHEFASLDEAVELARVFYPDRVAAVARLGSRHVPYEVLGINAPRDLAWKVAG